MNIDAPDSGPNAGPDDGASSEPALQSDRLPRRGRLGALATQPRRHSRWRVIVLVLALPALAIGSIVYLVATGGARFDQARFIGMLGHVVVGAGALALGGGLAVWSVRRDRPSRRPLARVFVALVALAVFVVGFLYAAPDSWSIPVLDGLHGLIERFER